MDNLDITHQPVAEKDDISKLLEMSSKEIKAKYNNSVGAIIRQLNGEMGSYIGMFVQSTREHSMTIVFIFEEAVVLTWSKPNFELGIAQIVHLIR